jgi:hypothetical protein
MLVCDRCSRGWHMACMTHLWMLFPLDGGFILVVL